MGKKSRAKIQSGIIDIGSHSTRLEIFEIAPDGGYVMLEQLSREVNLGFDVFRDGVISPTNVNILCKVLEDFAVKLREYGISLLRVVATSAFREAFNRELVINRVKNESGLTIEILETQEEARIYFLSMREMMRRHCDFDSMTGLAVIVGSGSLIINFFEKGVLKFSEAAALGNLSLFDESGRSSLREEQILDTLFSLDVKQRLIESVGLKTTAPLTLIAMGAAMRALAGADRKAPNGVVAMAAPEMLRRLKRHSRPVPEKTASAPAAADADLSLAPAAALLRYFIETFDCGDFYCPEVTTRSALIDDMIRRRSSEADPFIADIVAAARGIGRKYGYDEFHAEQVRRNASSLFRKLKGYYGFDARAELLLEVASLLHDIGRFVDTRQHHKHSCYLIDNAQLPGIDGAEQKVIAAVARYHRRALPQSSHMEYMTLPPDDKVRVLKLAAILRVADALDQAHREHHRPIRLTLRGDMLSVKVAEVEDADLENFYLGRKSDLFWQVFGLRVRLEEECDSL